MNIIIVFLTHQHDLHSHECNIFAAALLILLLILKIKTMNEK